MKNCARCGIEFEPARVWQKYCTHDCAWRFRYEAERAARPPVKLNCRNCDKPLPEDSEPKRRYCNTRCQKHYLYWQSPERYRANSMADHIKRRASVLPRLSASNRRRLYGLEPDDFRGMLIGQAGRCACCDQVMQPGRGTVVDHDHATGKVRSLLCSNCNLMIGNALENPANLFAGVRYLAQFQQAA